MHSLSANITKYNALIMSLPDSFNFRPINVIGNNLMHQLARVVFYLFSLIIIIATTSGLAGYLAFQASLPALQGRKTFENITTQVNITRDENGVPSIQSESRTDTAFALGYLHAQERFFQMDTMRRYAAGELSELFGEPTLNTDITNRTFRFREQARIALANLTKIELLILEQYTLGVNQGLADHFMRPFEYLMLLKTPVAWQKEDSLLIQYALYLYNQDPTASQERARELLKTNLPEEWYNFLQPRGGKWDSPIAGESVKIQNPIPQSPWPSITFEKQKATTPKPFMSSERSNVVAVSTQSDRSNNAIVSNNIDIPLTVPNLWYRAEWLSGGNWIRGLTIPGMPQLIIGSNEHVAWGLAASRGDYIDRVILETNPSGTLYLTAEGWENFSIYRESIRVARSDVIPLEIRVTKWGPVIGEDSDGKLITIKWAAYEKNAVNFQLLNMEYTRNIDQALTVASHSGMTQQDFLVADKNGDIGWTILGVIPNRTGFDGKIPESWSSRKKYWSGIVNQDQYPSVRKNVSILIAANNRLVSGLNLSKVGQGRYELGERANRLDDNIKSMLKVDERALVQSHQGNLDSFYIRWKQLFVETLAVNKDNKTIENLPIIDLVSIFRTNIINNTTGLYFDEFESSFSDFNKQYVNQMIEYTTWQLLMERPDHLLPKRWATWNDLLSEIAETSVAEYWNLTKKQTSSEWLEHSMSGRLPGMDSLLNFLADKDHKLNSVYGDQLNNSASSVTFAVSPGNETQGLISMPLSQSGHPLSPYYRNSHQLWLENKYGSFVAGVPKWQLVLMPKM